MDQTPSVPQRDSFQKTTRAALIVVGMLNPAFLGFLSGILVGLLGGLLLEAASILKPTTPQTLITCSLLGAFIGAVYGYRKSKQFVDQNPNATPMAVLEYAFKSVLSLFF